MSQENASHQESLKALEDWQIKKINEIIALYDSRFGNKQAYNELRHYLILDFFTNKMPHRLKGKFALKNTDGVDIVDRVDNQMRMLQARMKSFDEAVHKALVSVHTENHKEYKHMVDELNATTHGAKEHVDVGGLKFHLTQERADSIPFLAQAREWTDLVESSELTDEGYRFFDRDPTWFGEIAYPDPVVYDKALDRERVYYGYPTDPTISRGIEQLKAMFSSVQQWCKRFFQSPETHKWNTGCYDFSSQYDGLIYVKYGDFIVSEDIDNSVKNTFNALKLPVNQFAMWRAFTGQQLHTLRSYLSKLNWKHIEVKRVYGHAGSDWSEVRWVTLLLNQPGDG